MFGSGFKPMKLREILLGGAASLIVAGATCPALAQADPTTRARLDAVEQELNRQSARLAEQDKRLGGQEGLIEAQALQLRALRQERDQLLLAVRATGVSGAPPVPAQLNHSAQQLAQQGQGPSIDDAEVQPVGEAPSADEPQRRVREVAAVPEGIGVLSKQGQLTIDPSVEYSRSSNNRLVFRGVEIVPGVQLGVIEATDADRDTLSGSVAARYGLTNRLELEGRVPYIYRQDRITTLAQRDATVSRTKRLDGQDLGDVELSARYQINRGVNGHPVFVANARVKPPTGTGPFDVRYDQFGVATELATGSGFWGYSAGVTMIYPTDPAVFFAGLTYGYNAPRSVNKTFGLGDSAIHVGSVDPGDSIGLTMGFGLALNPQFSVSMGYSHTYIFPTDQDLSQPGRSVTTTHSNALQVGSMLLGWSYQLNKRLTISNNYEFGVTSDASDMRMVIRMPYRF